MDRRKFIRHLGTAGLALPAVAGLRNVRAFAQSPSPRSPFGRYASPEGDRVLVIVRLFGGNDGLNTVVPYADDNYYLARSRDSVADLALKPEQVLRLPGSDRHGLHPSLAPLLPLYEEEKIAVVQNVGYPGQDLSHFRSTDIWLSATDPDVFDESGWLGRYLEERYPDYPALLPEEPYAIEVGTVIGRALLGYHETMGFTLGDTSHVPDRPEEGFTHPSRAGAAEEAYIREGLRQSNIFLESILAAYARRPPAPESYPDTPFARDMSAVAGLITGGLRTQMYVVNMALYDFHATQLRDQATLFDELAPALAAFQREIEGAGVADRVTLMTISEFGRRVVPVGSGTDHGAASMLFVIGAQVRGGIIGSDPDLSDLDGVGNLRMEFDFRQVYATMLGGWLGASGNEMNAALFRSFEQLPIFRRSASDVPGTPGAVPLPPGAPFPNPATDRVTIRLQEGMSETGILIVSDGRGVEVLRRPVRPGERFIRIDVGEFPAGQYFYRLQTEGKIRGEGKMTVL